MTIFIQPIQSNAPSILALDKKNHYGQSLVEFVMIVPVIIMFMVIAAYVGMAMYHGNMASSAVKGPSMQKLEMARNPATISEGDLLGFALGDAPTGNINEGGVLDTLTVNPVSPLTSVMIGEKTFTAPLLFADVDFVFSASESIQRQLLELANQGGDVRAEEVGIRRFINKPTEHPTINGIPSSLEFNSPNRCAFVNHGHAIANLRFPNGPAGGSTYISRIPPSAVSPFTLRATQSLIPLIEDNCPLTAEEGLCQEEYNDFLYVAGNIGNPQGSHAGERSIEITEILNPPGAAAQVLDLTVTCSGDDCLGPISQEWIDNHTGATSWSQAEFFTGTHGDYHDPSREYIRPPDSFIDHCMRRKQAECIAREVGALAQEIVTEPNYRFECDAN